MTDLKGKSIALVDRPAAPSALALMARVRKETGMDPKVFFARTVYLSDDARAVLALYRGEVDAAVMAVDARDQVRASPQT
ncbi:MAG: PhnD/SsuA/transferrin family substrate-binding protein [Chloroflexi bacterium]|nr:PhnD/SsuA/transferrin family substrate-binding protein [Chloroflexota bacterium]